MCTRHAPFAVAKTSMFAMKLHCCLPRIVVVGGRGGQGLDCEMKNCTAMGDVRCSCTSVLQKSSLLCPELVAIFKNTFLFQPNRRVFFTIQINLSNSILYSDRTISNLRFTHRMISKGFSFTSAAPELFFFMLCMSFDRTSISMHKSMSANFRIVTAILI